MILLFFGGTFKTFKCETGQVNTTAIFTLYYLITRTVCGYQNKYKYFLKDEIIYE